MKRIRLYPYWAVRCSTCKKSLPLEEAKGITFVEGQLFTDVYPKNLPKYFTVKCPNCKEEMTDYISNVIFHELDLQLFDQPQELIPFRSAHIGNGA
jgi:phage FluMu protein Com